LLLPKPHQWEGSTGAGWRTKSKQRANGVSNAKSSVNLKQWETNKMAPVKPRTVERAVRGRETKMWTLAARSLKREHMGVPWLLGTINSSVLEPQDTLQQCRTIGVTRKKNQEMCPAQSRTNVSLNDSSSTCEVKSSRQKDRSSETRGEEWKGTFRSKRRGVVETAVQSRETLA